MGRLSEKVKDRIKQLINQGYKDHQIAKEVDVTRQTVAKYRLVVEKTKMNEKAEKPTIDKVTLVPDQPLTEQEKQGCIAFLTNYEPKIIWEVGQKVTAYVQTKIIELYIRNTDPRTVFIGLLAPEGEIHIAEHQQIGEHPQEQTNRQPTFTPPRTGPTGDPILTVHRIPPDMEIQIKIKTTKE